MQGTIFIMKVGGAITPQGWGHYIAGGLLGGGGSTRKELTILAQSTLSDEIFRKVEKCV